MTNIDDAIELTHFVVVVYDEDGFTESSWDRTAARYRAECSCGWAGDWHRDGALADADGDDHREMVIGPGDDLDRLMGELLDLQDDLARVVMWLAEHWSADLPVPRTRGGLGDDRIELSAYCSTADELIRAAATLGVPLVDDPAPDTSGNRYRRATRPFGRVRLLVYRSIALDCDECGAEVAGGACLGCVQRVDARAVTVGAA